MSRKPEHVSDADWQAAKSPPLSDKFMSKMQPAEDVLPELFKRSRGKQKAPTKVLVTLRLDRDVLEHYKSGGRGWQTRINADLKKRAPGG